MFGTLRKGKVMKRILYDVGLVSGCRNFSGFSLFADRLVKEQSKKINLDQ